METRRGTGSGLKREQERDDDGVHDADIERSDSLPSAGFLARHSFPLASKSSKADQQRTSFEVRKLSFISALRSSVSLHSFLLFSLSSHAQLGRVGLGHAAIYQRM